MVAFKNRYYAIYKKVLALFYDTDNIGDETYASIGVYEGTTKNNVLNVVPL